MQKTTTPAELVEELQADLEGRERAVEAAVESVQSAAHDLEELETKLANTTSLDTYRELEEERDEAKRRFNVARAAREENSLRVAEVKVALAEAEKDVHRSRYRELAAEREVILARRDELATELKEVLGQESTLRNLMTQELRCFDQDQANNLAVDAVAHTKRWLRSSFKEWLR